MDYYRYTMSLINSRELLQEFVKRYQVKYMLYETPRVLDAVRRGTFDATQWKILAQDKRFLFMQYEPSSENVN
ncbi:hypothetical protein CHU94_15125 [Rhodoferax sp. TH121]|nr:hypothetical protein CHU94_15125 [Rhodoferax sp. TH121]